LIYPLKMVIFHCYVSLPGSEVTEKSPKLQFPSLQWRNRGQNVGFIKANPSGDDE